MKLRPKNRRTPPSVDGWEEDDREVSVLQQLEMTSGRVTQRSRVFGSEFIVGHLHYRVIVELGMSG